ncbi:MAG: hypothetical protein R3251_01360 [Candidatus Spechtbacterales bacterium]|nr:hypothetical protein [Candidatus Spechtbacterales bacterium]
MSLIRYALIDAEENKLVSVLEKHVGTDQLEEGQRQKQIRIIHSGAEEEAGSLQELLLLPYSGCRALVYGGPGLTFGHRPKYFAKYKDAISYVLEKLANGDTHSATVELFETPPEGNSGDASFSAEDLEVLGIA